MNFDIKYFKEIAHKIFNTHSPSGYSVEIDALLIKLLTDLGYTPTLTNKGNVCVKVEGNSNENEQTEYPIWKPWDGISKDYQIGAIVVHNGEVWESTFAGQNVWEPGTVGDNFWIKKS